MSTPVACRGGQSVAGVSPVVGTVRWKPYQERWLTKALLTAPLREVAPRLQTSLCPLPSN
ncbi:hypothetical protein QUB80_09190 [Chlorogloeopsis sp. ULAP01]|nr:hypothetical protein [Chlorogloeopsis sp. ULAP01]